MTDEATQRSVTASGGGVAVRLPWHEWELLRSLPAQLRALLAGDVDAPGVRRRLFPAASQDPELAAAFAELTGESLSEEKLAAIDTFAASLAAGESSPEGWQVELSAGTAAAWLAATNDARLVLGTLAGITTEADWERVRGTEHVAGAVLDYLGWLQEQLIVALSEPDRPLETRGD